jgi:hypothetical protein
MAAALKLLTLLLYFTMDMGSGVQEREKMGRLPAPHPYLLSSGFRLL